MIVMRRLGPLLWWCLAWRGAVSESPNVAPQQPRGGREKHLAHSNALHKEPPGHAPLDVSHARPRPPASNSKHSNAHYLMPFGNASKPLFLDVEEAAALARRHRAVNGCDGSARVDRTAGDIVFMLIETVVREEWFFSTRAIPAHASWGRREIAVYVVEETKYSIERWRGCTATDVGVAGHVLHRCVGEPLVLLAPGCTDAYYGAAGPCCKYDFAVSWFRRSSLFERSKWFVFADDDVFFRVHPLVEALGRFPDPAETAYVLNTDGYRPIWGHPECDTTRIADDGEGCLPPEKGFVLKSGWFQPMLASKRAVETLAILGANKTTSRICDAWKITHDVGLGVLLWQVGMPVGSLSKCAGQADRGLEKLRRDVVFVHGARVERRPRGKNPDEGFHNHTALQRFFDEKCFSGPCNAPARLEALSGVQATAWFQNGSTAIFEPEDCAREQNAARLARNRPRNDGCWCARGDLPPWPDSRACSRECIDEKQANRRRRLGGRPALCAGRGWCERRTRGEPS